jgi:hypothetical protein
MHGLRSTNFSHPAVQQAPHASQHWDEKLVMKQVACQGYDRSVRKHEQYIAVNSLKDCRPAHQLQCRRCGRCRRATCQRLPHLRAPHAHHSHSHGRLPLVQPCPGSSTTDACKCQKQTQYTRHATILQCCVLRKALGFSIDRAAFLKFEVMRTETSAATCQARGHCFQDSSRRRFLGDELTVCLSWCDSSAGEHSQLHAERDPSVECQKKPHLKDSPLLKDARTSFTSFAAVDGS